MGRESSSSARTWELSYDAARRAFWFYPYSATRSFALYTGADSTPVAGTWMDLEIRYDAAADGGAQPPGVPTALSGVPGDGSVILDWSTPASDGGGAISGYRITPYVGATAQTPVFTASGATHATVDGLSNGTAHTFRVAALDAGGTGLDSAASAAYVRLAATTVPGAPGTPSGNAGDRSVTLDWTASASDGYSPITGYRITPYAGGTALPAVDAARRPRIARSPAWTTPTHSTT
jgi:hypothetical protein